MSGDGLSGNRRRARFGPGFLVTAAFIGPGTVVTASNAGAEFGYALLWALLVAVACTIVLQEMAARLGLVARRGLAQAIRESVEPAWVQRLCVGLVLLAIVLGNTAYQTGNLMGAGWGFSLLTGLPPQFGAAVLGGAVLLLLLWGGNTRFITQLLIAVVLLMSAAFVATAITVRPDVWEVVRQTTAFSLPEGSMLTALALIGTTVVPYNLFLHAQAVQKKWPEDARLDESLRDSRIDTVLSVLLGGLVTMSILVTAAVAFSQTHSEVSSVKELAEQLQPLLGTAGTFIFALGLFAAGLTSAITAPLAAGYVAAESIEAPSAHKWEKGTAVLVVLVGTLLAATSGSSPQRVILVAQAANGLLLPLVACFLLWVVNRRRLLGQYCNNWLLDAAAAAGVGIATVLGVKGLWSLNF